MFIGRVPHQERYKYLDCILVFAMLILEKGCYGVILEAVEFGLSIKSPDYSFNDDILTICWLIRTNIFNIHVISNAFLELKNSEDKGRTL